MRRIFDGTKKMTAFIMIPVITAPMIFFAGCGATDAETVYEEAEGYEDYAEYEEYEVDEEYDGYEEDLGEEILTEEDFDEYGEEEYEELTVEKMMNRPVTYETENVTSTSGRVDKAPIEVTLENFCEWSAIEYAKENKCEDYLLWFTDYVVNVIEPQAVEKILQIPVLAEAAKNDEISKYISVYVVYNDEAGFGAMEQSCYLGRDMHGIEKWDTPFYYIGHKVNVNMASFKPESKDDPYKQRFLESAMIHEIMHAFVTDYLFNLSLGLGRDGARVLERDENGEIIMDEDGDRPIHIDEIPTWLQEGLALTVENPYGTRGDELKSIIDDRATPEEFLEILADPESVDSYINTDLGGAIDYTNFAKITEDDNTYNTGWVATLFICAMAGEKLGYELFDKDGFLNNDAVLYGLNDFLTRIHYGESLDYFIADVSFDYDLGQSAYNDTTEFEEKCFSTADDPGLIFMQRLLYDFVARSIKDPENYIPSGSVLPGYVNGVQKCIDSSYHKPAPVYQVDNKNDNNPWGDYFSIATIPMSHVALSGGRRTSYDPLLNPLSAEEEAERDFGYIGDQKKYIDLSLEDD